MTAAPPSFELGSVDTPAGPIPVVRRGPADGPRVLILQPLFEEMNRCRRFLADLGRQLADMGIASLLPDLPGAGECAGESRRGLDIHDDVAASLAANAAGIVAMRGGCLIGGAALPRFHIAPVAGQALLRDMMRAQAFADLEASGARTEIAAFEARAARGETILLTGYSLSPAYVASLATRKAVEPASTIDFEGPPIWRQAEPQRALAEARRIAAIIAAGVGA